MNHKKIAFIIAVNDELYFEECKWYLNRLQVPEGYEMNIVTVREAVSMAAAYNEAMESSDAKYKVYLHQDVFLYNRNFIKEVLDIFQTDQRIGIMGVVGASKIPEHGAMYHSWDCGAFISGSWNEVKECYGFQYPPYVDVQALDGLLLITQWDIRWREDILKQWDYYDIAQCFEFIKAGYKVVIPYQQKAWELHDCGYNKLRNYNSNRRIMREAYPEFITKEYREEDFLYEVEKEEYVEQYYHNAELAIDIGQYEVAESLLAHYIDCGSEKNLLLLKHMEGITRLERQARITPQLLNRGLNTKELLQRYTKLKFYLRRLEQDETATAEEVYCWIRTGSFSYIEIMMNIEYNILDKNKVIKQIAEAYYAGEDGHTAQMVESCMDGQ